MVIQLIKRCSSSDTFSSELESPCQSEVGSFEQNFGNDLQIRCENCRDLNPHCLPETEESVVITLAEAQRSRDAGCKFCRLLCETYAYYYRKSDVDWPDFRFKLAIDLDDQ